MDIQLHPRDARWLGTVQTCDWCDEEFVLQQRNMIIHDQAERWIMTQCDACKEGKPVEKETLSQILFNTGHCPHGTPMNQTCKECNILDEDLTIAEIDQHFGVLEIKDCPEIDPWQ